MILAGFGPAFDFGDFDLGTAGEDAAEVPLLLSADESPLASALRVGVLFEDVEGAFPVFRFNLRFEFASDAFDGFCSAEIFSAFLTLSYSEVNMQHSICT